MILVPDEALTIDLPDDGSRTVRRTPTPAVRTSRPSDPQGRPCSPASL